VDRRRHLRAVLGQRAAEGTGEQSCDRRRSRARGRGARDTVVPRGARRRAASSQARHHRHRGRLRRLSGALRARRAAVLPVIEPPGAARRSASRAERLHQGDGKGSRH
jgi:hypothetical protein